VHYRSVADLNADVVSWACRLPADIDVIVGIPRSGLLVANLLSLYLNRPLADVDGLLDNRLISAGNRLGNTEAVLSGDRELRILVVDDSVWSGGQMNRARQRLALLAARHTFLYGAVYVVPGAASMVDFYYEKLAVPRAFEWNALHHPALAVSGAVVEGLLWPADTDPFGSTAEAAERALRTFRPGFMPSQPIGRLIAVQHESARVPIENWLAEHEISYGKLFLIPPVDTAAGRSDAQVVRDKARLYRPDMWIFIEGTNRRAASLARVAGRPVYSFETRRIYFSAPEGKERHTPNLRDRLNMACLQGLMNSRARFRAVLESRVGRTARAFIAIPRRIG
jgi:orotate phosphoribosyltransferase